MNALQAQEQNISAQLVPPHNYEAERAILGAILMNNRALERVSDFLAPDHFADPANGEVYGYCLMLQEQGKTTNPVTLKSYAEHNDLIRAAGGVKYLASLAGSAVTVINAGDYGKLIYDLWHRRELIRVGEQLINDACSAEPDETSVDIQEGLEAELTRLSQDGKQTSTLKSLRDVLMSTTSMWDQSSRDGLVGLSYGMPSLDFRAGLMQGGQMIVIGARPSMGKTSLARDIAFAAARQFVEEAKITGKPPKHVVFFTSEMSNAQQGGAVLTGATGIMPPRHKDALTNADIEKLVMASQDLADLPIIFDDTPSPTLTHMRSACRRVQRMPGGLGLIIGDYLQIFGIERGVKIDGPVQMVTYLSKGWKEMCRLLDVPGVVLSQLNRSVEQRENKRPMLSDLRESGAIEQDADVIMFVYRDEYYLERETPKQKDNEGLEQFNSRCIAHNAKLEASRGKAEVIAAKVRLGAMGTVYLDFDGPRMSFSDPKANSFNNGPPPGHPAADQIPMEL